MELNTTPLIEHPIDWDVLTNFASKKTPFTFEIKEIKPAGFYQGELFGIPVTLNFNDAHPYPNHFTVFPVGHQLSIIITKVKRKKSLIRISHKEYIEKKVKNLKPGDIVEAIVISVYSDLSEVFFPYLEMYGKVPYYEYKRTPKQKAVIPTIGETIPVRILYASDIHHIYGSMRQFNKTVYTKELNKIDSNINELHSFTITKNIDLSDSNKTETKEVVTNETVIKETEANVPAEEIIEADIVSPVEEVSTGDDVEVLDEAAKDSVVATEENISQDNKEEPEEKLPSMLMLHNPGDIVECRIQDIINESVFVKFDNERSDGIIPAGEYDWNRSSISLQNYLKLNQIISCKISGFDENKNRYILSHKQLIPDPWPSVAENYMLGQIINIECIGISSKKRVYIFKTSDGIIAIMHDANRSYNMMTGDINKIDVGDKINAAIKNFNPITRYFEISQKDALDNSWVSHDVHRLRLGQIVKALIVYRGSNNVVVDLPYGMRKMIVSKEIKKHPDWTQDKVIDVVVRNINPDPNKIEFCIVPNSHIHSIQNYLNQDDLDYEHHDDEEAQNDNMSDSNNLTEDSTNTEGNVEDSTHAEGNELKEYESEGFEMTESNELEENKEDMMYIVDHVKTTPLGEKRILKNVDIPEDTNILAWCKYMMLSDGSTLERVGKNFYIYIGDLKFCINASTYTIFTVNVVDFQKIQ